MQSTEILLINDASQADSVASARSGNLYAPVGLFCLSFLAPERIKVLDLQHRCSERKTFDQIISGQTNSVIFRFLPECTDEEIGQKINAFRSWFPEIKTGIAGRISNNPIPGCDFMVSGNGKQTINRLLNGERPVGLVVEDESMSDELPVPDESMPQAYNYATSPEKTIVYKTLEICQPWRGFEEFLPDKVAVPDFQWFDKLIRWLGHSGFNEFHLIPGSFTIDHLPQLSSLFSSSDCQFAISFETIDADELKFGAYNDSLKQIWLYRPDTDAIKQAQKAFDKILMNGCQPCLAITRNFAELTETKALLDRAQRLSILDIEQWQLVRLKKLLYNYWSLNGRFFKRLFSIRTSHELIAFMRTAFLTLDILFSSDRKGR